MKARAKGKAKSRNRKLRPCTICFPMERKTSEDSEAPLYYVKVRDTEDSGSLTEANTA